MDAFEKVVGRSEPMLEVFDSVRLAAETDCTILLVGESGTGKELIAEAVHKLSPRRRQPYIAVNIAAIPETLVESELFGHVKGAFTGATAPREGRFEAADQGTLFIDEIGDFRLDVQAKLLRVLENETICPVGGNNEKSVSVRIVAATSRDLDEMISQGEFRDDLYYRLNVVQIRLPPLRDRCDDIPVLVEHFLKECCNAHDREVIAVEQSLMNYLERYSWPGNVRQLRNAIESMVVLARDATLTLDDLPDSLKSHNGSRSDYEVVQIPPGMTLEELECQAIHRALEQFDGNRTRAAEELGISVRTLQRRLKNNGRQYRSDEVKSA